MPLRARGGPGSFAEGCEPRKTSSLGSAACPRVLEPLGPPQQSAGQPTRPCPAAGPGRFSRTPTSQAGRGEAPRCPGRLRAQQTRRSPREAAPESRGCSEERDGGLWPKPSASPAATWPSPRGVFPSARQRQLSDVNCAHRAAVAPSGSRGVNTNGPPGCFKCRSEPGTCFGFVRSCRFARRFVEFSF